MRQDQGVHDLAGEKRQVNGTTQKRLAGKVAVVTGSSRGIGKAIARALGAEGAIVGVHYCHGREQADELAAEFERNGCRVGVFHADVAKAEDCHKMLQQAAKQLGPVDILVNNAGINRDRSIRKMSAGEWDEVIQTNLNSVFHCSKAVLEPMIARGWGRIINIASIIGQTGAYGQANYAAAKAGVTSRARSLPRAPKSASSPAGSMGCTPPLWRSAARAARRWSFPRTSRALPRCRRRRMRWWRDGDGSTPG